MLGKGLDDLEILHCHLAVTHLTGHAHSFEHLGGIRAGTYRTGSTQTVVLAVGSLTNAAEAVALYNALIAFTLADALDVDEIAFGEEVYCQGIAEF